MQIGSEIIKTETYQGLSMKAEKVCEAEKKQLI